MRQCMDADNLHRRLKKIIGQAHGDADQTIESFTKAVERFSNMG